MQLQRLAGGEQGHRFELVRAAVEDGAGELAGFLGAALTQKALDFEQIGVD